MTKTNRMSGTGLVGLVWTLAVLGTVPARAQTFSEVLLHNFNSPKGALLYAGVIRDSAGNLYGTTYRGGTAGAGVVYKLDAAHHYTVLYNFTGGEDGGFPYAGVIRDSAGNLYGTTYNGGTANVGVVYRLDASGNYAVLYSFTGGADGSEPWAGVIRDSAGSLYGTTYRGGTSGYGVVYKLDTGGNYAVLYSFTGGADGGFPVGGVIRDAAGNLYGTAETLGAGGYGAVYKLDAAGNYTTLHSFTGGDDGGYPYSGLIRDSAGNLYGTTYFSSPPRGGVVYKLDSTGNETVLYHFTLGADGGQPWAGVIRDSAGNLYGTTSHGGAAEEGVVYKVGTQGQETVLYSFTGGADGSQPRAGVIRDPKGNLHGTTNYGGKHNRGVVFKLTPQ